MKNILIILLLVSGSLSAQKQMRPLYNLNDPGMKNSGWHFSPGLIYMLPSKFKTTVANEHAGEDEIKAAGRIGLYAEVGRHHLFDKFYFLDHLDYGVAYKKLSGKQTKTLVCPTCDEAGEVSIFKDNFVGAYVNFSNIWQISDYSFIQNGFGVNADYRFNLNAETDGVDLSGTSVNDYAPEPLQVQLHYKLSFGTKAEKGVFLIPSIEIPILNLVPFDSFKSTLPYFDNRYRPIIFSLKFMFLSKRKPGECKGKSDGKTGHQLWGSKRKR